MPNTEQVMTLLRTRRSIRDFRDKPLLQNDMERIIDGAHYAPSGHNSQSTEYLVVQDRAVLNQVSAMVIEYLKFEISRFSNPLFRTLALLADRELAESGLHEIPGFKRMIRSYESGADPILHNAPALLVFHAKRTIGYGDVNAQLALQNASLVAHSLGIGHFLHRMGARSLPRSHGADMEQAHTKFNWHSTWKRALWSPGAWVSDPKIQEHDREKYSESRNGHNTERQSEARAHKSDLQIPRTARL